MHVNTILLYAVFAVLFYIIGSIPNALIVGKLFNKTDVRQYGSGNLGATNTMRVLGKKAGILTFILDFSKCLLPILLLNYLVSIELVKNINPFYISIFLAIGHCYPIFAGFKGGKAVSSSVAILASVNIVVALIAAAIFFTVTYITKYVSVGSTILVLSGLVAAILFKETTPEILAITLLLILVVFKHIPNYKKLVKGTENKAFSKKNK